jgi:membrane protease YdiL (CAAX protease family)
MVTAGLFVAAGGATAAVILRVLAGPPSPPNRPNGPRWPGSAVVIAFLLVPFQTLLTATVEQSLQSAGFFGTIYGPGFPLEVPKDPSPAQKAAATIRYVWANVLTFPVLLAAMLLLPRRLKVANPLAGRGWSGPAVAGYWTWLIITPAAYCLFVLASLAHMNLTGQRPEKHPLTALGDMAGWPEWTLFVVETVLIAPVFEEWLFRGVLLPWLAQTRATDPSSPFAVPPNRRPTLVLTAAVAASLAFTLGTDYLGDPAKTRQTLADPATAIASYVIPPVFFLLLIPLDYVLPRLNRLRRHLRIRSRQQVRAILASAALFAAFHTHVWPSPVPLVLLAVALGYLYLRTRNLIGPIVVHGLFNAVSAVYLLLGGPA